MSGDTLLLGLGNLLNTDDGLGIRALETIRERYHVPEDLRCLDGGVMGLELLSQIEGASHLLVLDAVQTGQAPGTLVRLQGEEVPKVMSMKLSMHQINFEEVLALSVLRGTTPPVLVVWGLEPASLDTGLGLSEVVEARMPALIVAVVKELEDWGIRLTAKTSCQSLTPPA